VAVLAWAGRVSCVICGTAEDVHPGQPWADTGASSRMADNGLTQYSRRDLRSSCEDSAGLLP